MELKTFITVKQVDKKHQLKDDYLVINEDKKSVKIHDPYEGNAGFQRIPMQKPDAQFHFKCDQIFEGIESQKQINDLYKQTCKQIVSNVKTYSKNGIILQYGQSKSGKSTALFGNEPEIQTGLIQLAVNQIFEQKGSTRNIQNIDSGISVFLSIFDVYLETVRDFGKYFFDSNGIDIKDNFDFEKQTSNLLEKESAELFDNSKEIVQVRNLSTLQIKSPQQFKQIVDNEKQFRIQLDEKHKLNSKRYSQIYVLKIQTKNQTEPTYLYFVKLAGSEKIMKESIDDQQRVQNQLITSNSLFSLSKFIGGLNKKQSSLTFHDSKLTKSLHGVLQKQGTQVRFIIHLYPVEQNYEESLLSLQYMDRLKSYESEYKKVLFDGPMPEQVQAQERLMERLNEENEDLKQKYNLLMKEEQDKLEEIRKKLDLEFPVEQLITAQQNSKEYQYLQLHQEADERCETLKKINESLNKKLQKAQSTNDQSDQEIELLKQKYDFQAKQLEQQYVNLEIKYEEINKQIQNKIQQDQTKMKEELNQVIQHGHILMEEKAHLVIGINEEIKKTSQHSNKVTELKEMGKREAEIEYKSLLNQSQKQYQDNLQNLKEQYEHLIQEKENQFQQFQNEVIQYTKDKKDSLREARKEIVQMFLICKNQSQTIQAVQDGSLSGGIKSYNIPSKEIPLFPEQEQFEFLYKSLSKTKTLVSREQNRQAMEYTKQKIAKDFKEQDFEDTYLMEMTHKLEKNDKKEEKKVTYSNYEDSLRQNEYDQYRRVNENQLDIMSLDQLRQFTKALQGELKRCQNSQSLNPIGISQQTLENLIQERENYKQLAVQENKRINDAQEVLYSQKRLIEKTSNRGSKDQLEQRLLSSQSKQRTLIGSNKSIINSRPGTQFSQKRN